MKFDITGVSEGQFGTYGSGVSQFQAGAGIASDPTNNVYLSDYTNHRVQKYNASGTWVWTTGGVTTGTGNGQFNFPHGVAVDPSAGKVYVADTNNARIQVLDATTGAYVSEWNANLSRPAYLAQDTGSGSVYVGDNNLKAVLKYSKYGYYQTQWGSSGTGPGQFSNIQGVAVDALTGNVYVADANNHTIQIFDSVGNLLDIWGSSGGGDTQFGGTSPIGVALDPGGNIYTIDTGNGLVKQFGP